MKLPPEVLKTFGYLISTFSVILLAIVSWKATQSDSVLRACLIAGGLASILGMFCRWLSYEVEKKNRRSGEAAQALSGQVRHREMNRR